MNCRCVEKMVEHVPAEGLLYDTVTLGSMGDLRMFVKFVGGGNWEHDGDV